MDQLSRKEMKNRIASYNPDKPYVFVSYCSSDEMRGVWQDVVELQRRGMNIWIDKEMVAGDNWYDKAKEAMNRFRCKGVLFYVSEASITSKNVESELAYTESEDVIMFHLKKSIPIFPIELDDTGNDIMGFITQFAESNPSEDNKIRTATTIAMKYLKMDQVVRAHGFEEHDSDYYEDLIHEITTIMGQEIITPVAETQTYSAPTVSSPVLETKPEPDHVSYDVSNIQPTAQATEEMPESKKGKAFTTTGDITYMLYGQSYTDNQSNLMLNVFEEVIKRHPKLIPTLQQTMHCVSSIDFSNPQNMADMPSYFRACRTFSVDGQQVCVGTSYSMKDKLNQIAHLFQICGENPDVLSMEGMELPQKTGSLRSSAGSAGSTVNFTLFDVKHTSNQSALMLTVFEEIMMRTPESAKWALDNLTCASSIDYSNGKNRTENMPSYFRVCKTFLINGSPICIGTAYSLQDKLKMIARLLKNAGFSNEVLSIEGYVLPNVK